MHTYVLVQSSYMPTRFGDANHHHEKRQNHRPKTLLLECNAHIAIFRARLQNSRLCHALYVGSVTFNTELSMSHMVKHSYDINSSVLKREAKYSDVCLTRWTQSNSSVFCLWCCLPWWWRMVPPKNVGIWRDCISMYILLVQLADNNLIDARYKEHCVNNSFMLK
jgi:hypothetical protein